MSVQLRLLEENDPMADSYQDDDFYTHQDLAALVRESMGGVIELDPASHPVANTVVDAEKIYTVADDGLKQQWFGRVWLSPPAKDWQGEWAPKAIRELTAGNIAEMCLFVRANSSGNAYMKPLLRMAQALGIPTGERFKPWGPRGYENEPFEIPNIYYFGPNEELFRTVFGRRGLTAGNISPWIRND